MEGIVKPISWEELRAANRKLRGIEESDFKMCESCEVQHDCADIYEVDGSQLCEGCKNKWEYCGVIGADSIAGLDCCDDYKDWLKAKPPQ